MYAVKRVLHYRLRHSIWVAHVVSLRDQQPCKVCWLADSSIFCFGISDDHHRNTQTETPFRETVGSGQEEMETLSRQIIVRCAKESITALATTVAVPNRDHPPPIDASKRGIIVSYMEQWRWQIPVRYQIACWTLSSHD